MDPGLIRRCAADLVNARHAVAFTGAGISTESGIPDFRGPSGIWTKDPEAERRSYEIFGILKAIITQNIDGLHQKAGSKNVLEFHGSIYKLRCIYCGCRFPRSEFEVEVREKKVPLCRKCRSPLKVDVVYFTEPIPGDVYELSFAEAMKCDLMLVCGTSAVVYPAAELPRVAKRRGARVVEVNFEETPITREHISDYILKGKAGEILPKIVEVVKELRKKSF